MNTLPPELIRELYTKMDVQTAYRFRATCRDYNRVLLRNRCAIRKIKMRLAIGVDEEKVSVALREPDSVEENFVLILRNNWKSLDTLDEEHFDYSQIYSKECKVHMLYHDNMVGALGKVVANLAQYFHFEELDHMGILDETVLETYLNFFNGRSNILKSLHLTDSVICFQNANNWVKFLSNNRIESFKLSRCLISSYRLFTEEAMAEGFNHLQMMSLVRETSLLSPEATAEIEQLMKSDSINRIDIKDITVRSEDIEEKITRFIDKEFPLRSMTLTVTASETETLVRFLDTVAKRNHSVTPHLIPDRWELKSMGGRRRASITVDRENGRLEFLGRNGPKLPGDSF